MYFMKIILVIICGIMLACTSYAATWTCPAPSEVRVIEIGPCPWPQTQQIQKLRYFYMYIAWLTSANGVTRSLPLVHITHDVCSNSEVLLAKENIIQHDLISGRLSCSYVTREDMIVVLHSVKAVFDPYYCKLKGNKLVCD